MAGGLVLSLPALTSNAAVTGKLTSRTPADNVKLASRVFGPEGGFGKPGILDYFTDEAIALQGGGCGYTREQMEIVNRVETNEIYTDKSAGRITDPWSGGAHKFHVIAQEDSFVTYMMYPQSVVTTGLPGKTSVGNAFGVFVEWCWTNDQGKISRNDEWWPGWGYDPKWLGSQYEDVNAEVGLAQDTSTLQFSDGQVFDGAPLLPSRRVIPGQTPRRAANVKLAEDMFLRYREAYQSGALKPLSSTVYSDEYLAHLRAVYKISSVEQLQRYEQEELEMLRVGGKGVKNLHLANIDICSQDNCFAVYTVTRGHLPEGPPFGGPLIHFIWTNPKGQIVRRDECRPMFFWQRLFTASMGMSMDKAYANLCRRLGLSWPGFMETYKSYYDQPLPDA